MVLSAVAPARVASAVAPPSAGALLLDAYAAQHHGTPSPQSIQSVAVHLLVLHGVFSRELPADSALWIRRQATRRKGVYSWLTPPPVDAALSLRHCFPGQGVDHPAEIPGYVVSVYEAWRSLHREQLETWYRAHVDT